jgi:hypothetical protein
MDEIEVPNGMDVNEEQDIIVATYGSVVFGVGYQSQLGSRNGQRAGTTDGWGG